MEWEVVFLTGLADGISPVSFSLDFEEEMEEEHRLFYVGITRSKNYLFLTMHHEGQRSGISRFNKISRFIDAPNVLFGLETGRDKGMQAEVGKRPPPLNQIHDKRSLLEKLIKFFK